jgi:hypothetical protein
MAVKDENSLTSIEYEEIYAVLNDYCLNADRNYQPPTYTLEVRQAKATRLKKIMRKMEARMKEFPPNFV